MVPMGRVEEAISAVESKEWFFSYLNNRFSRDVFISYESMHDQLNLIGIPFNSVMVKAFPAQNEELSRKAGKRTVEELFKRRNEIAHQNDRDHASAIQNDITRDFVNDYILKIEAIVNAIDSLAVEADGVAAG